MIFATDFSEVLNSPLGIGLAVVFFGSALIVLTTALGFATTGENQRAQGLDEE